MSSLTFDPWTLAETQIESVPAAKVANPANPTPLPRPVLAELAGLAGVPSSMCEIAIEHEAASPSPHAAILPAVLDLEVQRMAEAMFANPVYRITNAETAMAYFRANALTLMTATDLSRRQRKSNV